MSRILRRLRVHGLIEKAPLCNRYYLSLKLKELVVILDAAAPRP
jgi:hypothetical protein